MKLLVFFTLGLALLLSALLHPAAQAQVQLAAAGKATAVIVADDWAPEPTAAFAQISVTAGQRGDLLDDTFRGAVGQAITRQGWNHSKGVYVVSYRGAELGVAASARTFHACQIWRLARSCHFGRRNGS